MAALFNDPPGEPLVCSVWFEILCFHRLPLDVELIFVAEGLTWNKLVA
jgi:hypothetical protein